jgi:GT2 family glycosyltransferase
MKPDEIKFPRGDTPLVSVVVVCFTGVDLTRQCLTRLFSQTYPSLEVIVVDNGAPEKIHETVRREFPRARLICLDRNTGFSGGHNAGIRAACGKYVAIINNDALAAPHWVQAMVEVAEGNPDVGSVASVIIDGNRPDRLDSCGVGIALDGMSRQAMRGGSIPVLEAPREVLMPSGCACLFRKEALDAVGLFDESFFAYCEDTDLGMRLRWAGYTSFVAPGAEVIHYYSMTAGKFSLNKVFWVERNHFWVAIKNFPVPLLFLVPLSTVWRYVLQAYAVLTRTGDLHGFTDHVSPAKIMITVVRAQAAALAGMFSMIRKRLSFSSRRKLTNFQMMKVIWSNRISLGEIILGLRNARQ